MPLAARHRRFEGEPALRQAVRGGGFAVDPPPRRPDMTKRRREHGGDAVASLDGDDVPGEGDEIAPIAVGREQTGGGGDILLQKGGIQRGEPTGDLSGGGEIVHRRGRVLNLEWPDR